MAGFLLCALPEYVGDKDGLLLGTSAARVGFVKRSGSLFDLYDNTGVLKASGATPAEAKGLADNHDQFPSIGQ